MAHSSRRRGEERAAVSRPRSTSLVFLFALADASTRVLVRDIILSSICKTKIHTTFQKNKQTTLIYSDPVLEFCERAVSAYSSSSDTTRLQKVHALTTVSGLHRITQNDS